MAAKDLFNDSEIKSKVKNKLKVIKKLNLEKGLLYLQDSESELYAALPREDSKTVMLKVEKKKNVSSTIESVKEDLQYILNVGQDIITMAYGINTYNNIVYIKRKY